MSILSVDWIYNLELLSFVVSAISNAIFLVFIISLAKLELRPTSLFWVVGFNTRPSPSTSAASTVNSFDSNNKLLFSSRQYNLIVVVAGNELVISRYKRCS